MWKHLAIFHGLADGAVRGLDCIGGVDHLADVLRIVEQRNQVLPVAPPALADGRVFLVPRLGKGGQFLLGFLGG
jgi:hypothetical protein